MGTGILSPIHLVFLLIVVLMLFGAKRLPEMGKSLGSGLRGFKESLDGTAEETRPHLAAADPVGSAPAPATNSASLALEQVGARPESDAAA